MGLLQEKLAKYDLPQKFMAQGVYPYFREIEGKQGTEVEMGGHEVLMFGSNAYTGLTGDERVIEAGINAMHKYGSGCAGSRFLNGTLDLHVQLEKELAAFVGKDEALCFSTGFTVNSGVIPALTDRNDYIICDDRDHASIVDGRRLSFSQQLKYKHNDMADLEKQLQKCNLLSSTGYVTTHVLIFSVHPTLRLLLHLLSKLSTSSKMNRKDLKHCGKLPTMH